jgi:hypothetical protein
MHAAHKQTVDLQFAHARHEHAQVHFDFEVVQHG